MLLPSNPSCVLVQMEARTLTDAPAYRRMSRHSLTAVAMARIRSVPQEVTARHDEAPASAAPGTQLQIVHRGALVLRQGREEVPVRAGEAVLYDADRPFSFVYPHEFATTIVQVPTAVLGNGVASGVASIIPVREGLGAVFARLVAETAVAEQALSAPARDTVSTAILETMLLLTGSLGQELRDRERSSRRLVAAVYDHLAEHALEPGLSPARVAAAMHVSTRTLHAAFADQPETVGAAIRRIRIDAARLLLRQDPAQSVSEVARAVGFLAPAHFGRVFRSQHGVTPERWRRLETGVLLDDEATG